MCAVKLIDRKSTEELINKLDVQECWDMMTTARSMRWSGHVLRKEE